MVTPPSASILEGIAFTATAAAPNAITGLFSRKEGPVKVANLLDVDRHGFGTVRDLVRKYGPGPFYVRVAAANSVLVTDPEDIKFVLEGSPSKFASNPAKKQAGMVVFQPDALTLSRSPEWEGRRSFAEHVLATGKPLHPLAQRFLEVAYEEADQLAAVSTITWTAINEAFQRITRRVVLGESAARDKQLTETLGELMMEGNSTPGKTGEKYPDLLHFIKRYTAEPDPNSLAGLFADAPGKIYGPVEGQVIHWLFAMGDTLPANLLRALALLATHPIKQKLAREEVSLADLDDPQAVLGLDYVAGCLFEAMRIWPTTPMLGRVALEDVEFPGGAKIPAGTDVLIHNIFNHRNGDRIDYADRFAPEEWSTGNAGKDWGFNFFSHGPQGCPGAGLSVFLGQAVLARLLASNELVDQGSRLTPANPLPYTLNHFTTTVGLTPAN